MTKKRTLTGYRPTGKLHIGHWFGNLQNMLQMQHDNDAFYFIADYHALTTVWQDPSHVRESTEEMVLDWLAAGLDPDLCTIYRQSDVSEVVELMAFFSMVTPKPWLERVPSYKEQREQITDKDLGNLGFFLYPLLQAADITIVLADEVPVGEDQLPHLELTREIVRRFNTTYGDYLVEPKAAIAKEGARVPGTDGRKMSKSYGNVIPLFAEEKALRKVVMKIKTNSLEPGQPKDTSDSALFDIYRAFATDAETVAIRERYAAGIGWGEMKQMLFERINTELAPARAEYERLIASPGEVERLLKAGADNARAVSKPFLAEIRDRVGIRPLAR
jgi:tryptophanyl-tRNA synthetase